SPPPRDRMNDTVPWIPAEPRTRSDRIDETAGDRRGRDPTANLSGPATAGPARKATSPAATGSWLPAGRVPRLGPGALAGPQRISLVALREPVGVLALQLQHALGVVEERLTAAVKEGLLT